MPLVLNVILSLGIVHGEFVSIIVNRHMYISLGKISHVSGDLQRVDDLS